MKTSPIQRIKRDLRSASLNVTKMNPGHVEQLCANALSLINDMTAELGLVWAFISNIQAEFDVLFRHIPDDPPGKRKKKKPARKAAKRKVPDGRTKLH